MESTWQLDLINSTKSGSSTPLRKPAKPFIDLTNVRTERRREVCDLFVILVAIVTVRLL